MSDLMTGQPAGKGVVSRLLEDEKRNKNLSDVVDRVNSGKGSKSDKEAVDRAVRSGRVRPPSSSKSKSSETVDSAPTLRTEFLSSHHQRVEVT